MIRKILFAAVVVLAACGQSNSDAGVMAEIQRGEKADAQAAQQASAGNDAFLAQVRAQPGVEALPSGLLLQFRHRSANQSLPQPTASAAVLVHYEGKLKDGSVFDSSFARNEPAQFPLAGVVPGFSSALSCWRSRRRADKSCARHRRDSTDVRAQRAPHLLLRCCRRR